jgi:hypothetical protein
VIEVRTAPLVRVVSSFIFSSRRLGPSEEKAWRGAAAPRSYPGLLSGPSSLRLLPFPALQGFPSLRPSSRGSGTLSLSSSSYVSFLHLQSTEGRPPLIPPRPSFGLTNPIIWIMIFFLELLNALPPTKSPLAGFCLLVGRVWLPLSKC